MKSPEPTALKETLSRLYMDRSKHSSYQSIPDFVANAIDFRVEIKEDWRGDRVRLAYIESRLSSLHLRNWCDFGANTGFFTLTMAHQHRDRHVLAIEANPAHASFIETITSAFGMKNVEVLGEPVTFETLQPLPPQDVMLHLNVLHHAGMDFDQGLVTGPEDFFDYAEKYLRLLRGCTRHLVFQMGSNLWGDKSRPLIDHREDAAKLVLFSDLLTRAGWHIDDVSYAARTSDARVAYRSLSGPSLSQANPAVALIKPNDIDALLAPFNLDQHPGEFYRRPLFICSQSLGFTAKEWK